MVRRQPPKQKQVSFPIPGQTWLRLKAAAAVLGQSQAAIVSTALQQYFDALPAATRQLVDQILVVRDKV